MATWNRIMLYPSVNELKTLEQFYGDIHISDSSDIVRIQNFTIKNIKHQYLDNNELIVSKIIEKKSGYCYDRSLLLQKILLANHINIRPVYLFYFYDGREVSWFNFFSKSINSHNIFEFKWHGKWYVMKTNTKMNEFVNLDEYINLSNYVPKNTRYIRYLNNRNARFIYPSWIPDFYY